MNTTTEGDQVSPVIEPDATLDRDTVYAAVAGGNIPCLLPVLYQLTGERRWLAPPYFPGPTRGFEELNSGGLPPDIQAEIHTASTDAILDWAHAKPPAHPAPHGTELASLMSAAMGEQIPESYAPMVAEHLGFAPYEPEDLGEQINRTRPDFSVIVVGAGVSGLACAINLQKAGVPYTVLERNDHVGGTWWENNYPGARVDIPSDLYSFSFHPNNWSENFARRDEIFDYLNSTVDTFGISEHIQFGQTVDGAHWDDDTQQWTVSVTDRDGRTRELRSTALVTAAGLHNTPNIPNFPGLDTFEGTVIHSARWPEGANIDGKRVAVVGNGASAMQVVAAIADRVDSMTILQRQPQWIAPNEHYFQPADQTKNWLFDNVPFYRGWYRFRLYWLYTERTYAALRVDPRREEKGKHISSLNDAFRSFFTAYLTQQLEGREDLQHKSIPDYPPFGKRLLLDNGWFSTLKKPHVELLTEGVGSLTPSSIVSESGEERDIDVVILCTGFQQQRFLFPMDIRGRDGLGLRESWQDDNGRAYLGITAPKFPNLFFLYGPNTNPPGGSYITIAEAQVRYVVDAISALVTEDIASLECRPEPYEEYNAELDRANDSMVYAMDGVTSYYRNTTGRVVTNSPWAVPDYWTRTQRPELTDFVVRKLEK
jgi:4-hydroxyacetophenone monooxygenase